MLFTAGAFALVLLTVQGQNISLFVLCLAIYATYNSPLVVIGPLFQPLPPSAFPSWPMCYTASVLFFQPMYLPSDPNLTNSLNQMV